MIILVKALMTAATVLFVAGLRVARSDRDAHRRWMLSGAICFLATAVVLVAGVRLFGAEYAPAGWLRAALGAPAAHRVLLAHRALATLSALLLGFQVYTGWRRRPVHRRSARWTFAFWIVSYLSGLAVFV